MNEETYRAVPGLLDRLGLNEEPMGLFYTDRQPDAGSTPTPMELPTREREQAGELDWAGIFGNFSCAMRHIWIARKQKTAAWFSAEHYGCPGAAFWLGFNKPQAETLIHYVSTGIPGWSEGELYCESPDALRQVFHDVDPRRAPRPFLVVKPLSLFEADEEPELVAFFSRPESLGGLHQLAFFVTNDPEVVQSPWSAGCGSLAAWPLRYLTLGLSKAVIGGWDASARKYYKADELSFTVPYSMFRDMVTRYEESFLSEKAWATVQKKIARSKKAWGEEN